jgi:hypothetical protein
VQQTYIAHNRDDDREDRSVLFNDAVNYKNYVASVACEWSIGGMILTGKKDLWRCHLVRRWRGHTSTRHTCVPRATTLGFGLCLRVKC